MSHRPQITPQHCLQPRCDVVVSTDCPHESVTLFPPWRSSVCCQCRLHWSGNMNYDPQSLTLYLFRRLKFVCDLCSFTLPRLLPLNVKRIVEDTPIYEVRPENGPGRSRILHRNLLLVWKYSHTDKNNFQQKMWKPGTYINCQTMFIMLWQNIYPGWNPKSHHKTQER
jgi:hypothetical protein